MLSQNIGIIHRITYASLVHYEPGNLLASILDATDYSNKTSYLFPDDMWTGLPKDDSKGIANQELKEPCIEPPKLYETFVRACGAQTEDSKSEHLRLWTGTRTDFQAVKNFDINVGTRTWQDTSPDCWGLSPFIFDNTDQFW